MIKKYLKRTNTIKYAKKDCVKYQLFENKIFHK